MVIKVFAFLLAVNLFTVVANAEAADLGQYDDFNTSTETYKRSAGDDEILIEDKLSKSDCLLRVVSMLGSRWFNDSIELQRLKSTKGTAVVSRYPLSFKETLAQARYGLDVGSDDVSVSMKIKF